MKAAASQVSFWLLAVSAVAGDLNGHVVITKRLSRKTLAPVTYSLRGAAPDVAPPRPVDEYDRVAVWLEGDNLHPKAPENVTIDQREIDFVPDMLIVPIGSTVSFPNSDPIFHNVFSLSRAKAFDLGFYPRGQSRSVKFDRPGVVQIYCHVHSKMYAVIVVTSSPWYAKPAADGSFNWTGVPAGHYRLCAWHKVAGLFTADVTVNPQGSTGVTIRIPVDREPDR